MSFGFDSDFSRRFSMVSGIIGKALLEFQSFFPMPVSPVIEKTDRCATRRSCQGV